MPPLDILKQQKRPILLNQRKRKRYINSLEFIDKLEFEVNIWDIYVNSRAKKIASMFESNPQTIDEFKKTTNDINDIVFEDNPFQKMLFNSQAEHAIPSLIEKLVIEGKAVMAILPSPDALEKWVVVADEYKIIENVHIEKIYLKLHRTCVETPIDDDPIQKRQIDIWIEYDVFTKIAILKKAPDTSVFENLSAADLKQLNIETATFTNVAAHIFKLNHEGISLFDPIQERSKNFNNLGLSICKEAYMTSTGLIMDTKKFSNGESGAKDFINDFIQNRRNSIIAMAYKTGANAYQAPVTLYNPQPRLNDFYSSLEKEFSMADEEIGMHRSLASDGKSNNKTAGQVGGHNTPSYNLILKLQKILTNGIQSLAKLLGYEDKYVVGLSIPIKKEIAKLLNDNTMVAQGGSNGSIINSDSYKN